MPIEPRLVLAVGVGGALGSVARYLISATIARVSPNILPTLAVNVVGCFLIAVLLFGGWASGLTPAMRAFLAIGILGGFTTMSSFGFETIALFEAQKINLALANIVATMIASLGGTWIGWVVAKALPAGTSA